MMITLTGTIPISRTIQIISTKEAIENFLVQYLKPRIITFETQ